ncbi:MULTISPECIES: class I SAM-dependent methyltransferase [Methylobacterium]|jgi:SAM-dependent methyltransferase|uniref:class I SAM-dependent methyltransferase n=1 Tax=Methylobacterium TaxID=407 RepID=UPI0008EF3046|nr:MULTISPECIES: class I SAM-dependent methyltransferase [Methylobacterium]MBZ6416279.1 class I SAM-dependent methyltransferase [Methylobacterium sp.]SFE81796.1 Methyltransferase domain-containing protein [Methylobacterium sp. yr596]
MGRDHDYVHGYAATEQARLCDRAATLESRLHRGARYPAGGTVLEAGSGVGAQTIPLLRQNPDAVLTCVDIAAASLAEAQTRIRAAGLPVPTLRQADLRALPFPRASFDHAFVCFVLEHLPDPPAVLAELRRVVRPGGSLTVIEGDHGSVLLHPEDTAARAAIACQVALQRRAGCDPEIEVRPRPIYADGSRPDLAAGFVRRTFAAMVAGIREEAIRAGLRCGPRRARPRGGAGGQRRLYLLRGHGSRAAELRLSLSDSRSGRGRGGRSCRRGSFGVSRAPRPPPGHRRRP